MDYGEPFHSLDAPPPPPPPPRPPSPSINVSRSRRNNQTKISEKYQKYIVIDIGGTDS